MKNGEGGTSTAYPPFNEGQCNPGQTCTVEAAVGTEVTVTAVPNDGFFFDLLVDCEPTGVEVIEDFFVGVCVQTLNSGTINMEVTFRDSLGI